MQFSPDGQIRIKQILDTPPDGREVVVHGWVRTKREAKNVVFVEVNDGSSFRSLQVVVDRSAIEQDGAAFEKELAELATGASVEVAGRLVASPGGNQASEMQARRIRVVGRAPSDSYPLQKKRHSFEYLREIAHLRPRTNTFGAVARVRNAAASAIHEYFQERDFIYVHTPIITASDAEGAGEMFQVTTLPLGDTPKTPDGAVDFDHDFFGKKASLTVSGQLEAEIYALALGNVYTFGPTFRAENSNTSRHLAEFWMIEPEMAFCDITGNMDLAESFIKSILGRVLRRCPEDMAFFNERIQPGITDAVQAVVDSPFVRTTYGEAVAILGKQNDRFEFPVAWGADLQSEHEKFLTEEVYKAPVIVTDYPKEIKAFYMKVNADGKTVRAMDVLVPRLGEIVGGSQREDDLAALEARMDECRLSKEDYWWYLDLRRYGTVPHSGFGLGFERLIQYMTGMQNIRDVIPFPRAVKTAEF